MPGATFTATRVPGIDTTTNAGQQQAASLTATDAQTLTQDTTATATATTDAQGLASLTSLPLGLYLVQETSTPTGYLPAQAFLVTLPLTDPDDTSQWLTTVHVYPKNAHVSVTLDVTDQDAVTLKDHVSWHARADIPVQETIDGYHITQRIADGLTLDGDAAGITVGLSCQATTSRLACPTLEEGTHYQRTRAADGSVVLDFTDAGRTLLADTIRTHPGAGITLDFTTTVTRDGDFVNEVVLAASRATIDGGDAAPSPVSDTASTRWGPLAVLVHEVDHPEVLIPGARFQVYASAEDAAARRNPVTISGVDEWTSDADGSATLQGLRFSHYVNGLDREDDDPLARPYYVVLTHVPEGWQGSSDILQATVASTDDPEVVVVQLWQLSSPSPTPSSTSGSAGAPSSSPTGSGTGVAGLPVTGAQLIGVVLLAAVLAVSGVALVLGRRRRRGTEDGVSGGEAGDRP